MEQEALIGGLGRGSVRADGAPKSWDCLRGPSQSTLSVLVIAGMKPVSALSDQSMTRDIPKHSEWG